MITFYKTFLQRPTLARQPETPKCVSKLLTPNMAGGNSLEYQVFSYHAFTFGTHLSPLPKLPNKTRDLTLKLVRDVGNLG